MTKPSRALERLQDTKAIVLEYLHRFKDICEAVLDIGVRDNFDICKTHTLREWLDVLEAQLVHGEPVENDCVGASIAFTFGSVVGNLNLVALRDAIHAFHLLTVEVAVYEREYDDVVALGLHPITDGNA